MTCLASHTYHIPHIHIEAYLNEEASEDTKRPLQPLRLGKSDEAIVGIKICHQVLYQQAKYLHALLGWRHHHHPVADDGVHDHV